MGVSRKHSEAAQDRDEKAQKLNSYVESMLAYLGSMAHDMPDEQKEKLKSIIDSKQTAEGGDEKLEEPKTEESKAEEPTKADEVKQEEPKPDEAKVVVDEAKADEGKVEEVKEDEAKPAEETQP